MSGDFFGALSAGQYIFSDVSAKSDPIYFLLWNGCFSGTINFCQHNTGHISVLFSMFGAYIYMLAGVHDEMLCSATIKTVWCVINSFHVFSVWTIATRKNGKYGKLNFYLPVFFQSWGLG